MNNASTQDLYFAIIETIAEGNFCPYEKFCPYSMIKNHDNCVECISEYVIKSGKFNKNTLDIILGE